jgi:hypothetical protein
VDQSGNIALQLSDVGYVSLVMPLDANAGRPTGTVTRQTLDYGLADARNSLDDAGRYLVYPNIRSNESQIWVKDLTTGRARHLMTTSSSQLNPVISRDGAQVAYTVPVNGRPSGYVIALTGGTAKKLCDDCVLHGWLPDNVGILAALGDRTRSVVIDTHSGMTDEILARTDAPVGRIDVSSDGRHLAFSIAGQVWMAPFRPGSPPGKDEWQLIHRARSGSAERACGWSPDSRILYLLLESDGFRCLYGQRVDVGKGTPIGEPFLVQHLHDPRRTWGSTPLGTAIVPHAFVFTQVERSGSIWLAKAGNQQP